MRRVLRELAPDIWVEEQPLTVMGVPSGRRMTVVRLGSGELWIHSPAPLDSELRARLDTLGAVKFVVAPSAFHGHLSMGDYRDAYPGAELFAGPGLAGRRRDLAFDGLLGGSPDPRWREAIGHAAFIGNRAIEEIVFLHRASRTLIVGDLIWNIGPGAPRRSRLWAHGRRGDARPQPAFAFRKLIRNELAARRSIDRILALDFDRILVGHGDIVESGGREVLRAAYDFLPAAP